MHNFLLNSVIILSPMKQNCNKERNFINTLFTNHFPDQYNKEKIIFNTKQQSVKANERIRRLEK